jgi:hypothetical protein
MTEADARAMIHAHFEASSIGGAGGAPGDHIAPVARSQLRACQ